MYPPYAEFGPKISGGRWTVLGWLQPKYIKLPYSSLLYSTKFVLD